MYFAASGDKCCIHHIAALQHLSLQGCLLSLQQNVCENGRQVPNNSTIYGYIFIYLYVCICTQNHSILLSNCKSSRWKTRIKKQFCSWRKQHAPLLLNSNCTKKWPLSQKRYILIKAQLSSTTEASQIQSFAILAILLLCQVHLLGGQLCILKQNERNMLIFISLQWFSGVWSGRTPSNWKAFQVLRFLWARRCGLENSREQLSEKVMTVLA